VSVLAVRRTRQVIGAIIPLAVASRSPITSYIKVMSRIQRPLRPASVLSMMMMMMIISDRIDKIVGA